MARTAHYFEWEDLTGLIPSGYATDALDDDEDGEPEQWEAVREAAEDAVDAYLEGRYSVPLTGEIPKLVKRAAVLFAAAQCYERRRQSEQFAHKRELGSRSRSLELIRDGKTQLVPGRKSRAARGAVLQRASRVDGGGALGA